MQPGLEQELVLCRALVPRPRPVRVMQWQPPSAQAAPVAGLSQILLRRFSNQWREQSTAALFSSLLMQSHLLPEDDCEEAEPGPPPEREQEPEQEEAVSLTSAVD